jgi:hypothetical protein
MSTLRVEDSVVYRGRLELIAGGPLTYQLVNDDGLPYHALKLDEIYVFPPSSEGTLDYRVYGVLHTHEDLQTGPEFNLSDTGQIAWASGGSQEHGGSPPAFTEEFHLIDPRNMVIRNLWLTLWTDRADDVFVNYFINCKREILGDYETVVALANEVNIIT